MLNLGMPAAVPTGTHGKPSACLSAGKICKDLPISTCRSTPILRLLITAALRKPKLVLAVALSMLVVLAGTMTYTGFLVIGVLADYLGTGRFLAGLLVGVLFARFPWISNGKLRVVGLLPKPVRRPLVASVLALSLLHFLLQGDHVPAVFTGLTMVFVVAFPWWKRAMFDRLRSSFSTFTGRQAPTRTDDMVIDGEFRERKDLP